MFNVSNCTEQKKKSTLALAKKMNFIKCDTAMTFITWRSVLYSMSCFLHQYIFSEGFYLASKIKMRMIIGLSFSYAFSDENEGIRTGTLPHHAHLQSSKVNVDFFFKGIPTNKKALSYDCNWEVVYVLKGTCSICILIAVERSTNSSWSYCCGALMIRKASY